MYISPQGTFKLLKNVPLNSDKKHTIKFASLSAQNTYMSSKVKYSMTNATYIKSERVVRVPFNAENLYDCNYCMFQNAGFGTKWFYAFITHVEYVNTEVSAISIELDYYQTWQFDITIGASFVEREHVSDDRVGLHTIEENLDTGDYIMTGSTNVVSTNPAVMVMYLPDNLAQDNVHIRANVLTPCETLAVVTPDDAHLGGIGEYLATRCALTPERVALLCMITSDMVGDGSGGTFEEEWSISRSESVVFRNSSGTDTYVPKNNKLKCYPYCLFTVDNYNGTVGQFHWEDFVNPFSTTFKYRGTPFPTPVMECYPLEYRTNYSSVTQVDSKQFSIVYDNFPMIPWAGDTYKQWLNSTYRKQAASIGASVLNTAVAGALGYATLGVGGAIAGVVSSGIGVANQITQHELSRQDHQLHGSNINGSVQSSGINWSDNRVGFRCIQYQIKAEYAQMIDEYFTRFGYKVNRYKVPELNSRQSFNFVKTVDCVVKGGAPNDALKEISALFDRGITLWHTTDIGNYSLNNGIVG